MRAQRRLHSGLHGHVCGFVLEAGDAVLEHLGRKRDSHRRRRCAEYAAIAALAECVVQLQVRLRATSTTISCLGGNFVGEPSGVKAAQ